jgi:DNA mismatch repair endonuclease MutH
MDEKYDDTSITSIVEYAQKLVGHSLREMTSSNGLADPKRRRGSFGNALEEYYFGYRINSDGRPDFYKVGLELKSTPLKHNAKNELVAKERLVVTMVNYEDVVNETFETSHFMNKAASILLVSYLWEKDANPVDYQVVLAEVWKIPEEDIPQIKADWETVVAKVRAGRAEDISGSDTLYLEACTKAADSSVRRSQPYSDVPAKPRAWALKASYMTAMENGLLEKRERIERGQNERNLDLLSLVRERFLPYIGMTEGELCTQFGVGRLGHRKPKNACALVTKRILGVARDAKIDEFEKAGIRPKTLRLRANGRPKEAVSFPAFSYIDLEKTDFEDSDFFGYLQQRYLFVIYREVEGRPNEYHLSGVCFWQMPDADLDEAKRCYDQMRENVREGHAEVSVKSSENRCCHVRPHGRNAADTSPQPHGAPVSKKCFWLNQDYLAGEIARVTGYES